MVVNKRVLAKLDQVYSVGSIELNEQTYFLAATEGKGQCLLISASGWQVSEVWKEPGGTMSLIPVLGRIGDFISIQKFFPIFKSQDACITYSKLKNEHPYSWDTFVLAELPFVHRIETVKVGNLTFIIASTLCAGKDFVDDWSRPGTVYAGILNNDFGKLEFEPILDGISKNHGMYKISDSAGDRVLISGKEGLFEIYACNGKEIKWEYNKILSKEISDISSYDIDDDGNDEIVAIEPFHGDKLVVYKKLHGEYQSVFEKPIDFGHVVWCGSILGHRGIIIGNRGGDKSLELMYSVSSEFKEMETVTIDIGVAPTQILVIDKGNKTMILSANHGIGEVSLYTITPK